jgi:hypothetical protein
MHILRRASFAALGAMLAFGTLVVGFASSASATPALAVTPTTTGLMNGQVLNWAASGMTPNALGSIIECNGDPTAPTIAFMGNNIPVGCSPVHLAFVSAAGTASGTFTIIGGPAQTPVGPPVANQTDSAGHPGAQDALNYPCPPTQAQVNLGIVCVLAYGTTAGPGDQVFQPIHFQGEPTPQSNIVVSAGTDVTGGINTPIALANATVTDPQSATPTLAWTTDGPNCTFDSPATLTTNITCTTAGVFAATLTVTDGVNPATSATVHVTVTSPNQPPVVDAGPNVTGLVSSDLNLNGTVTDPDSTPITTWSVSPNNGACLFDDASAPQTTINCDTAGTYIVTLTADDGINAPVTDSASVTVNPLPPGLNANAGLDTSGNMNTAITLSGSITDPGFTPTAQWTVDSPTCAFANANAAATTITCTSSGVFAATLKGTDGTNPPSIDTALVTVIAPNLPPTVNSGGNVFGKANTNITLNGTVTDPDNTPLVHWAVDSPNCSFANANLAATTINCTTNGVYAATLTGSDGVNSPVSATAIVSVVNNIPPTVSAGSDTGGLPNTAIALHGTVTDPDSSPTVAWSTQSPNCTFGDPTAADTTITCTADGVVAATLTADDGVNAPVSATAVVTVSTPNVPPSVTAGGDIEGLVNHNLTLNGSFNDPDSSPTVHWATGSPNCSFANANVAVTTIKCTATGIYAATLTAADGVNPPVSSTALVTIVPGVCQKPCLSIGDATGYEGSALSLPIVLSSPAPGPFTVAAIITPGTAKNCRTSPGDCDFNGSLTGVHNISFKTGDRFKYVSVTALTDNVSGEPDRQFSVVLTNLNNPLAPTVTLGKALGTGTIKDATGLTNQILVGSQSIPEMDLCATCKTTAKISIALPLSAPISTTVSMTYKTQAAGSATAGTNYTSKSGTLTFAAGGPAKKYIQVIMVGDNAVEAAPYGVDIVITPVTTGWTVANGPGHIEILDND